MVKEFFLIVVVIEIWGLNLFNCFIMFFLDNLVVVYIINKMFFKDLVVMLLVRRLVFVCLEYNILF